mmetsp:Transcript_18249/g.43911  ORF Transcript_18249/g.43911 Transcript_18249/m.43911 type:complete len:689 (+) Transcript_18249:272-2338(+)
MDRRRRGMRPPAQHRFHDADIVVVRASPCRSVLRPIDDDAANAAIQTRADVAHTAPEIGQPLERPPGHVPRIGGESPGAVAPTGPSQLRGGRRSEERRRRWRQRSQLRQDRARLRGSHRMPRPPVGQERRGLLLALDVEGGAEIGRIRSVRRERLVFGPQGGCDAGRGGVPQRRRWGGERAGGIDTRELCHGRRLGPRSGHRGIHQTNPPGNVLRRIVRVRAPQSQRHGGRILRRQWQGQILPLRRQGRRALDGGRRRQQRSDGLSRPAAPAERNDGRSRPRRRGWRPAIPSHRRRHRLRGGEDAVEGWRRVRDDRPRLHGRIAPSHPPPRIPERARLRSRADPTLGLLRSWQGGRIGIVLRRASGVRRFSRAPRLLLLRSGNGRGIVRAAYGDGNISRYGGTVRRGDGRRDGRGDARVRWPPRRHGGGRSTRRRPPVATGVHRHHAPSLHHAELHGERRHVRQPGGGKGRAGGASGLGVRIAEHGPLRVGGGRAVVFAASSSRRSRTSRSSPPPLLLLARGGGRAPRRRTPSGSNLAAQGKVPRAHFVVVRGQGRVEVHPREVHRVRAPPRVGPRLAVRHGGSGGRRGGRRLPRGSRGRAAHERGEANRGSVRACEISVRQFVSKGGRERGPGRVSPLPGPRRAGSKVHGPVPPRGDAVRGYRRPSRAAHDRRTLSRQQRGWRPRRQ